MKQLRAIRRLFAAIFFVACTVCLVVGPHIHPMVKAAGAVQILLSTVASTAGVTIVWIAITFLFGRVYCATACPVGTFSDIFLHLRRRSRRLNKPFRYRRASKWTVHVLWVYVLCVALGVAIVPFVIEPWNIVRNAAATVNPDTVSETWTSIGRGAAVGMAVGVISMIAIAILSIWRGREFCARWCPIGTALGYVQELSMMHIEIDPDKCVNCGKCEENCRSQCIKILSRHIDEKRCVRCFECVAECPTGAIKFQVGRNRPATPLMSKVKRPGKA